jgi:hypothetical protein
MLRIVPHFTLAKIPVHFFNYANATLEPLLCLMGLRKLDENISCRRGRIMPTI